MSLILFPGPLKIFDKTDEQSQACLNYAMARKFAQSECSLIHPDGSAELRAEIGVSRLRRRRR